MSSTNTCRPPRSNTSNQCPCTAHLCTGCCWDPSGLSYHLGSQSWSKSPLQCSKCGCHDHHSELLGKASWLHLGCGPSSLDKTNCCRRRACRSSGRNPLKSSWMRHNCDPQRLGQAHAFLGTSKRSTCQPGCNMISCPLLCTRCWHNTSKTRYEPTPDPMGKSMWSRKLGHRNKVADPGVRMCCSCIRCFWRWADGADETGKAL
mmetsp:Transcript_75115/g.178541  ORF Transcript_75115/g.178541 Transcript_75115/m.178541 type:complete len:204 (+) Transcript_75115:4257-4868(+)